MKQFQFKAFYAYPSIPKEVGDCVKQASKLIEQSFPIVDIFSWEKLKIGGRFIIDTILEQIDQCMFLCADLTGLNPNVLFEVGYAIGQNKRIWITMYDSQRRTFDLYNRFDLIAGIGYEKYTTSPELQRAYQQAMPHMALSQTLYDDRIAPNLRRPGRPQIVHIRRLQQNQVSVATVRALAAGTLPIVADDPLESTGQSLSWYGAQIHQSIGVIVHLMNGDSESALLHNAKCALIAGLARALGKHVLMLAEHDFASPVDYRDLLYRYREAKDAEERTKTWLRMLELASSNIEPPFEESLQDQSLHELRNLNLGQFVAENEPNSFVDDYFVETSSYKEALNAQSSVFVGRKGVGKTANLLKISSELSRRPRHLVCTIKPPAYEMEGLVTLLRNYGAVDRKSFAIESLWKFLIISEVANSAAIKIQDQVRVSQSGYTEDQTALLKILEEHRGLLREEFSIRLERAVELLSGHQNRSNAVDGVTADRMGISESLHKGFITRLRPILSQVLKDYDRVAILIDNLDQAWDTNTELRDLCSFVLGLVSVGPRLAAEFHNDRKLPAVPMTLTVFLRADIFHQVLLQATEPDKIQHTRIRWTSPELLLRVIEDRYAASFLGEDGANIWRKHFCQTVNGEPTKNFILKSILPRPRDIVFFTRTAIENAINRKSELVEDVDIIEADKRYSKHALDSVLVETAVGPVDIRRVVENLYGYSSTMSRSELEALLVEARVPSTDTDICVRELINLSLIGIEVADSDFRFLEEPEDFSKLEKLGFRYAQRKSSDVRYQINRPFWAHLEISPSK